MLKQLLFRLALIACVLIALTTVAFGKTPSAAQLLKQGSSYQAADDTTDRAADIYRQLIRLFPKSVEAEAAQFFLGSYYQRKFFILEQRNKTQDWDALNRAEQELYTYKGKYPKGSYLADTYHLLATIALRRGYSSTAVSWLQNMKQAAAADKKVYIFRMTWSPNTNDVVKRYCDTRALADANLEFVNKKLSFDAVMNEVTNWARRNGTP
jgi:hypothetical protein